jgi:cyanophycinase
VARRAKGPDGKLVLVTAATQVPMAYLDNYLPLFGDLGVTKVDVLDIRTRDDGYDDAGLRKLHDASVVFFTGGNQLRITTQMGGTPAAEAVRRVYEGGGTVAGTSAGATVMSGTMLTGGTGREDPDAGSIEMAPGLGLFEDAIVDSHFGQRGRIGRLMAAVAQNPSKIGLGIDEDTAIVVDRRGEFRVMGTGAVYVLDGSGITHSSLRARDSKGKMSLHNVRLHVLRSGERFDVGERAPLPA